MQNIVYSGSSLEKVILDMSCTLVSQYRMGIKTLIDADLESVQKVAKCFNKNPLT
jgi:hypothetical protein